jgi:hypothetical protein
MSLELMKCRSKWCEKELEGIAYQQISPTCVLFMPYFPKQSMEE